MPKKRLVTQFGMGTSIRSGNYTEACARAIRDAPVSYTHLTLPTNREV